MGLDWNLPGTVQKYLQSTEVGQQTLEFLKEHSDEIHLYITDYIQQQGKDVTFAKPGEYGLTHGGGLYGDPTVVVTVSQLANRYAQDMAATIVHEMTHAKKAAGYNFDDGSEYNARKQDIIFYMQLVKATGNMKLMYQPYVDKKYVKPVNGQYVPYDPEWKNLQADYPPGSGTSTATYNYGLYTQIKYRPPPVPFNPYPRGTAGPY
jgi:hypothetical protein